MAAVIVSGCYQQSLFTEESQSRVVAVSYVDDVFLGSPSVTKFNGNYFISHDYYGEGSTYAMTSIYRSSDLLEWEFVTDINGMFWGGLFVAEGKIYLLGVSKEYGDVVLADSNDGSDWNLHVILKGRYHTAPGEIVIKGGIVYKAYENVTDIENRNKWGNFILKLNINNLSNSSISNIVYHQQSAQWIEGNLVESKGGMKLFLRRNCAGNNIGVMMDYDDESNRLYNAAHIELEGAGSKFHIVGYDGRYILASNPKADCYGNRNRLSLYTSSDLDHWVHLDDIMFSENKVNYGFQYPSLYIDGNRLLIVIRVADDQPNFHDANKLLLKVFNLNDLFNN